MFKKNILLLLTAGALFLTSCEEVIELDVNTSEPQLVIEGAVTDQDGPQYIRLSESVPYTSTNSFPPVSGAEVTVTDAQGNIFHFLEKEAGLYSVDGLKAIANQAYTLRVLSKGKEYTATSVRPEGVKVDSLSIKVRDIFGTQLRYVAVHCQDPAGVANQYRFEQYINGVQVRHVYTTNDRLVDGNEVFAELSREDESDDKKKLKSGDIVEVEIQCIDQPVYKYWSSLADLDFGVTPNNPPGNISNGALGYFSAHTAERLSIEVP